MKREEMLQKVQQFIQEHNPMKWDGDGEVPKGFNTICTMWDTTDPHTRLFIRFDRKAGKDGKFEWGTAVQLADTETWNTLDREFEFTMLNKDRIVDVIEIIYQRNNIVG